MQCFCRRVFLALFAVVAAAAITDARALTDEEIFRNFRFNFMNPGARAMALGGAFVAEADDASAAQANPAALHYVGKFEVFTEYRRLKSDVQTFTTASGNLDPNVPVPGPYLRAQSAFGDETRSSLSFFSVAVPFTLWGKRTRVAFSRQVVLDVNTRLGEGAESAVWRSEPDWGTWYNTRDYNPADNVIERYTVKSATSGALEAQVVDYNLALSYSLADDFSVGVTGTWSTLDMKSQLASTVSDPLGQLGNPRDPRIAETVPARRSRIDGTDSSFGYTIGLHWHLDKVFDPQGNSPSLWRFGVVYHKGAKLQVDQVIEDLNPESGDIPQYDVVFPGLKNTLKIPDRFAMGGSYRSDDGRWVFSLDGERVNYSDLLEDFQSGVNFATAATTFGQGRDIRYAVDDATVVHAGLQYSFRTGGVVHSLRGGFYNAPDNLIRLTRFSNGQPNDTIEPVYKQAFGGGQDENHFTLGYGAQIINNNWVFQVAADRGDNSTEYVASAVLRFGPTR